METMKKILIIGIICLSVHISGMEIDPAESAQYIKKLSTEDRQAIQDRNLSFYEQNKYKARLPFIQVPAGLKKQEKMVFELQREFAKSYRKKIIKLKKSIKEKEPIEKEEKFGLEIEEEIPQKNAVAYVLKMNENDFRQKYGWRDGILTHPPHWKPSEERYQKIFSGTFHDTSIGDLKSQTTAPMGNGTFKIIFHDPDNPQTTDIRDMMAHPSNKHAAFQIASTFWGPLEGGKIKWDAKLNNMYEYAVQGEFASISTMGATIYRKYFLPGTFKPSKYGLTTDMYLLKRFGRRLPFTWGRRAPKISSNAAQNYAYQTGDESKVGIGIHQDIYTLYGYGDGGRNPNSMLPVIPLYKDQKITAIFTSTLDRNLSRLNTTINKNINNLTKMLLNAAYEGTIRAAMLSHSPKLYLTLIGGGSFQNPISYIQWAIYHRKDLIAQSGLDIYLNYRADTRRRKKQDDKKFLHKMIDLSAELGTIDASNVAEAKKFASQYLDAIYNNHSVTEIINKLHRIMGIA